MSVRLGVFSTLIAGIVLGAYFVATTIPHTSQKENRWICNGRTWIRQGQPVSPRPLTVCGTNRPATISVYFGNSKKNQNAIDCGAVFPVYRTIDPSESVIRQALGELVQGAHDVEAAEGYGSFFSVATRDMVHSVAVDQGIARIDFFDIRTIIPNASSSCGSAQLMAELDTTLKQFPEVHQTRYSINGSEADFYEWLQLSPPPAVNLR